MFLVAYSRFHSEYLHFNAHAFQNHLNPGWLAWGRIAVNTPRYQCVVHLVQTEPEPSFNSAQWQVVPFSDFPMCEALEISHFDHFSLVVRQCGHCTLNLGPIEICEHLDRGIGIPLV